jgi:hypothetical protein
MAMAVIFVLVMAGVMTWLIFQLPVSPQQAGIFADHCFYFGNRFSGAVR